MKKCLNLGNPQVRLHVGFSSGADILGEPPLEADVVYFKRGHNTVDPTEGKLNPFDGLGKPGAVFK